MLMMRVGLALGCLFFLSCSSIPDIIRLGHLDPQGDDSEFQALKLAVDELNADESNRLLKRRVEVIHRYAGTTAQQTHAQAVGLGSADRVLALLGGSRVEIAKEIGQAAQADEILSITFASQSGGTPNPLQISVGLSPHDQAKAIANFAQENGKRILMIRESTPTNLALLEISLRETFQKNKDITFEELTCKREEIGSCVKETFQKKVDILLLALPGELADLFVSALEKQKLPQPSHVIFAGEENDLSRLGATFTSNIPIYAATSFSSESSEETVKDFVNKYRAIYGNTPSLNGALAYDAFQVYVQLVRKAESIQSKKLREELIKKEATWNVLTGKIQFNNDGTCKRANYIVRLEKGLWKLEKRYE
jgi:ABC-type branched-subunit amino acid transport system substrate-binding protein